MKFLADDWPKALSNGILAGAILFYSVIPILGLATWHNVVPEHDHFFVSVDHHHDANNSADQILPQNTPQDCVNCNSSQLGINVIHLPNPAGSSSFFTLVIHWGIVFSIVIPPAFVESVPTFARHIPSVYLSPLDPPPNPST